ncbi:hypothetical protein [Longimicrobium sp.]|uniref:hypothetical protein n=1 Tax=Longimicrobium sp. TaxID=2029185 RepID=UPI003B3B9B72
MNFLRSLLAFAGLAPARRKLVVRVGSPIPYRVAVPADAEIQTEPGRLSAKTWDISVVAVALDAMAEEEPLPASAFGPRRVFTSLVMGDDALLFKLVEEEIAIRRLQLEDVVQTIGLLGGQRAAHLRGRYDDGGAQAWLDMHATVKNGVLYILSFVVLRGVLEPHDTVLARIHESFQLPE